MTQQNQQTQPSASKDASKGGINQTSGKNKNSSNDSQSKGGKS